MQYIDNDMDDLFRKAGENYPLKTGGADWDALQAKMAASVDEPAVTPARKSNRRYLWLLLLLLIPVFMVVKKGDNVGGGSNVVSDMPVVTGNANGMNNSEKNDIRNGSDGIIKKDVGDSKSISDSKSINGNFSKRTITQDPPPFRPSGAQRPLPRRDKTPRSAVNAKLITNNKLIADDKENRLSSDNDEYEAIPVDSTSAIADASDRQPKKSDSVSLNKTDTAAATVKKQGKKKDNKKGVYYGIIAGPDISTIKAQKVSRAGYSAGALVGYRLNNHWSIEGGVLWDKKNYYTKGEYFDKTGTNIPPSVTVHYLDGSCSMFEFPLAVRYDLNVKKNSFFFTAGLTSYVMKNEAYNYGADNMGNYYEGFRSYKNSGGTLFSNLQLSAGYNYNFSQRYSLRIEPYIKMPVRDIGIGKLPINSTGLYIGIFRNIR